jgi:hypothetical protein
MLPQLIPEVEGAGYYLGNTSFIRHILEEGEA